MFVSPNDRVSGSCRQSGDVLTGDGGLGATPTAFPTASPLRVKKIGLTKNDEPDCLFLISYRLSVVYPSISISSEAQINGPTPLASLLRIGSER